MVIKGERRQRGGQTKTCYSPDLRVRRGITCDTITT